MSREAYAQYEEAKTVPPEDEPPDGQVSTTLLEKSEGQLPIAPGGRKPLGQSGNDAQLWTCLAMKVKSDAVENIVA